jgi:hypothetical protein
VKVEPATADDLKDRTLKMEIDHAKAVGLPLRVAEAENARMLERSERIARDAKAAVPRPRPSREHRVNARGVTTKTAKPEVSLLKQSPCGRCGICRNCMRERRVLLIIQKRKEDRFLGSLSDALFIYTLRANAGWGEFALLSKPDVSRAIAAKAEEVCNLSVPRLGEWK